MQSSSRMRCALFVTPILIGLIGFSPPSMAELVINEMLSAPGRDWNGDGEVDFKSDEWVEILNTGPSAVSLEDLYLKDGSGDTYHYGFAGTLGAGEVLIVYGHESVAWQSAQGLSTTGLSLNNSGDTLELWRDILEPRVLEVVDAIDIPAHAAAVDRSMGRALGSLDWLLYDEINPYTGDLIPSGTACAPTPGAPNLCTTVPVGTDSWGEIKARHGD